MSVWRIQSQITSMELHRVCVSTPEEEDVTHLVPVSCLRSLSKGSGDAGTAVLRSVLTVL